MNRISNWVTGDGGAASQTIEQATFSQSSVGPAHAVFAPLHYEPNYAYPLLVWLHGPRDSERQLQRVMPHVSMRNYVAVAPRGTEQLATGGYDWPQSEDHILLAEHRVLAAIHAASERFNICESRVFLAGLSSGGTMAYRLALSHPQLAAGVLSIGGSFPSGGAPLRRLAEVRKLPIFLATGRDSEAYTPNQVCDDLRLMYTAGMSVNLRQYPCGDELTTQMLADLDRWVMEQVCGPSTASQSTAGIESRD